MQCEAYLLKKKYESAAFPVAQGAYLQPLYLFQQVYKEAFSENYPIQPPLIKPIDDYALSVWGEVAKGNVFFFGGGITSLINMRSKRAR